MYRSIPFGVASNSEITRQELQHPDRIVGRPKFFLVARVLWVPPNTAAQLAVIGSASERTAERWISGEVCPPYSVIEATNHELFSGYR
jgi:hypothetical protein